MGNEPSKNTFDCIVAGGGLTGSVAALAMAESGFSVAFVARQEPVADNRTTALMHQSIAFLQTLGIWDDIAPKAARLQTMRIIDGTKRLLRAPTVTFSAPEIGLDGFGYNIPNAPMLDIFAHAIARHDRITHFPVTVSDYTSDGAEAGVLLESGETLHAQLILAADGRHSQLRQSAGIDVRRWSYPQTAIVLNFSHSRPHGGMSSEFHTESGPFTQVPLPGNRSSLVWVNRPDQAEDLLQLPLDRLSERVEERMQSILGTVVIDQAPQAWPLSGMTAHRFGKGPLVLLGEAGHVFPPIGAQGLNLSLRDIITLIDLTKAGRETFPTLGDRFDLRRRTDVYSRTASVDLLNRSLLSSLLPVQMVRAAGLHILSSIHPLKQFVMREGIEPGGAFRSLTARLTRPNSNR